MDLSLTVVYEKSAARKAEGYNRHMDLDTQLERLAYDPCSPCDLAELALHLARDEYPDLDVEAYLSELAGIAHEATAFVRGDLPARVNGLCRYLFHEMGFHGNDQNYYDPRNSYLNQVLDRRTGIPITLSIVAMAIGCRAGLHVVGVGLPGHFVVKAVESGHQVLFDPFHGGRLLDPEQCETLVQRVTGVPFKASHRNLEPHAPGTIVIRMLTNLKAIYLREGDFAKAARVIERIRQLNPQDLFERRDLGISLLHAGQAGRAIDHLTAYLKAFPKGTDADNIAQLIARAKGAIAKWN